MHLFSTCAQMGHFYVTDGSPMISFQDFVKLVRETKSFVVSTEMEHYSKKISEVRRKLQSDPRYNENLHYPKVLRLEKSLH